MPVPSWKGQGADWNAEVGRPGCVVGMLVGCVGTGVAVAFVMLRRPSRFETPAIFTAGATITPRPRQQKASPPGPCRPGPAAWGTPNPGSGVGRNGPFA